jgi:Dehydratase family
LQIARSDTPYAFPSGHATRTALFSVLVLERIPAARALVTTYVVPARKLELLVSDRELEARRKSWKPPRPRKEDARGYRKLFLESVTQADRGCDFDFLANEATIHIPKS